MLAGRGAVGGVGTPLPGAPHPEAEKPAASAPAAAATPSAAQQPQQRQPPPGEGLFKSSSALPVPLGARQVEHLTVLDLAATTLLTGLPRPALPGTTVLSPQQGTARA